ncbi:LysR family transcriptional regulator [Lysobacter tyrosinilyticus]
METVSDRFDQALGLLTVVESGSFTRAAECLGVSKAHLSKQVQELEAALGVRLLHRTTRRIAVTDAGRLYLDFTRQARELMGDGERAVSAVRTEVDGLLRITAPTSFGDAFLVDLLADFRARHPQVRFDVDFSIAQRDLVGEGYDFAFRMTRTLDPSLIARGIGVMRELIVASPGFLAQHAPQDISDPGQLSALEAIRHRSFRDDGQWILQRGEECVTVPMRGSLAINHFIGMRRAALRGIGIARLPRYLVFDELRSGRLVQLLPEWRLPTTSVSLVYPSREHLPQRSRVFRDFVVEWFDDPEHSELLR